MTTLFREMPLTGKLVTDLSQWDSPLVKPKYEPQGVLLRLIGHQFTGLGNVETERDGSAGFLVSLGLHGQGGGGPLGDGFPFPLGD